MGSSYETPDWYVGGQGGIHLPEPEPELVAGRPELQYTDIHAFLFVVKGTEDGDLLFAKEGETSGTAIHDWADASGMSNVWGVA